MRLTLADQPITENAMHETSREEPYRKEHLHKMEQMYILHILQ